MERVRERKEGSVNMTGCFQVVMKCNDKTNESGYFPPSLFPFFFFLNMFLLLALDGGNIGLFQLRAVGEGTCSSASAEQNE